jgi:hypothetical protein
MVLEEAPEMEGQVDQEGHQEGRVDQTLTSRFYETNLAVRKCSSVDEARLKSGFGPQMKAGSKAQKLWPAFLI